MTNKVYTEKDTNKQRTRVSDREGDEANRMKQQIYAMSFLLNNRQPYLEPFYGCASCCHHFSLCIFKRKKNPSISWCIFSAFSIYSKHSIVSTQRHANFPGFQWNILLCFEFVEFCTLGIQIRKSYTVRAKKKPTGFVFNKRAMCVFNCGRLFGVFFFA